MCVCRHRDQVIFLKVPAPTTMLCCCSCGGVVVSSADGKIVCSNTIDERLKIAYAQNLPMIRGEFFGVEAPVREDMHL